MENNGLSTCGYIDFCPEDCQVEIFFFFKEFHLSYVAPNNSKLFSVFSWVRSRWNENATTVSKNEEQDQYELRQLGRFQGC